MAVSTAASITLDMSSLPDEILICIAEAVRTCCVHLDLLNFSLTCHRLHDLVEPSLIHTICIRRKLDVQNLRQALRSNIDKARYPRSLSVVPHVDETYEDMLEVVQLVSKLSRLQHVRIETPFRTSDVSDVETIADPEPEEDFWKTWSGTFEGLSLFAGPSDPSCSASCLRSCKCARALAPGHNAYRTTAQGVAYYGVLHLCG